MDNAQKRLEKGLKSLADRLSLKNLSQALYFPKYFEVETIRACNANCTMCTVSQWKDKNNRMSDKLFSKITLAYFLINCFQLSVFLAATTFC